MCSSRKTRRSTAGCCADLARLGRELSEAEAVVVGAGSGFSASAGLTYSGPRFQTYFSDFIAKYHYRDMYAAGFYPYASPEEFWAYWSRHIFYNRYDPPVGRPYLDLLGLLERKDYFVLTTNVDHCFQRAGFDKSRLFYTQGDYGLWQCARPCHQRTYDNEEQVRRMVAEQKDLKISQELTPRCPICGGAMSMNLRCDESFVQDEGWYAAQGRYAAFLHRCLGRRVLYLELGVGSNTPAIIKYSFWQLAAQNPLSVYACVNLGEAFAPPKLGSRALSVDGDVGQVLAALVDASTFASNHPPAGQNGPL